MRFHAVPVTFFLILFFFSCENSGKRNSESVILTPASGYLFIIGGGDRDDSLMQQMINISGWKKGDIMVAIPLSSSYDSAYFWINDQLQKMTGQACVRFDSSAIYDTAKLDSLRHAKIIFIGGGDQSRMMQLIEGSKVKELIQEAYQNGATIGGTSAGATIMSQLMITGNQLLDTAYQSTFPVLRSENLELKEGLGLLDSVIIDMHFVARSRYNRLFSAIMEYPRYQCIGIDEATAIIVHGDSATVAGESQVITIETPDRIEMGNDHLIGASGLDVSIYLPGEKFRIRK
ncbi:MAG: cyanophycinase [Chitinophagales bacterium]